MIRTLTAAALLCAFADLSAVASAKAETGIASWYGAESGPRTANGERFRPEGVSCAHRTRAFGSVVTVTLLSSGRSIQCRINDRGPFVRGRIIDLSHGEARLLGMGGTARASVR
jgi:rare lipoprotein A